MAHHGMSTLKGMDYFCNYTSNQHTRSDRFGRLFPDLPALYTDPDVLKRLGTAGGPMDGGKKSPATSTVEVGQVFFGQFIDHDITLDTSSSLSSVNSAINTVNVRTPTLDLDCIYGDGPEGSPFLYKDGISLLTGADGTAVTQDPSLSANDLARASTGTAIIGDPRNDENRIVSQIQLGMIRFHNEAVKKLSTKYSGHELYEEARAAVTGHYHWAILYDFLAKMCGSAVVWDILHSGRRFYCAAQNEPYIPVEFSVAAYRFGHSMAPHTIQVQKGDKRRDLFGPVLGGGFTPLADVNAIVDMHEIFDTSANRKVQKADRLDTDMAAILLKLPFIDPSDINSLATRNLLRGQSFLLPSGESVAALMERPEAEISKVSKFADEKSEDELKKCTPLWFYLLSEAETIGRETSPGHFDKGEGLGPVGARIVAEVLIGLMELDPRSFLAMNRQWSPGNNGLGDDVRTIGDMLTYSA